MERSMGWRPARPGLPVARSQHLTTLGHAVDTGAQFTDWSARQRHARLGVRAGQRHPDGGSHLSAHLAADRGRRNAEITCDPLGSAIHDGGISATARAARFGRCSSTTA